MISKEYGKLVLKEIARLNNQKNSETPTEKENENV